MQQNPSSRFIQILIDLIFIGIISLIGWFLTASYWHAESLNTWYPDWVFHAFRIKSLSENGFASWDHLWSNGINYWRAYQYASHVLTLAFANLFQLSVTRSMVLLISLMFILSRIMLYVLLRCFRYPALLSTLITVMTFTFSQQWVGVKDFSIFFFIWLIPLFVAIWIKAFTNPKLLYLLFAFSGAMWSLHPVMGYTTAGLAGFYYLFSVPKKSLLQLLGIIGIYLVSSAPFTVSYFTAGYHFTNPILSTGKFARDTIAGDNWGLSIYYAASMALCWILTFVYTGHISRWSKLLLLFCTTYLLTVVMVQSGYVVPFINQLQISRGTLLLGFILPFVFADYFYSIKKISTRLLLTAAAIILALTLTNSITTATQWMADPIDAITSPIATFFHAKNLPTGSIYTEQLAEASYTAPRGVRFVTSYNEHLEPSPLSLRFKKFVKNDVIYTGISDSQAELLSAYTDVLGVEYLFLSQTSPIAEYLVNNPALQGQFEEINPTPQQTSPSQFRVIHNTHPIHYAYAIDSDHLQDISFKALKQPNLLADSYQEWDAEMVSLRKLLTSPYAQPLPVTFTHPNQLTITLPKDGNPKNGLLVLQHYDNFWHVAGNQASVLPTSLRFMYIANIGSLKASQLDLVNTWPWWYWPVQSLGLIMVTTTTLPTLVSVYLSRKKP